MEPMKRKRQLSKRAQLKKNLGGECGALVQVLTYKYVCHWLVLFFANMSHIFFN